MAAVDFITAELVRRLFRYDPESGLFTRLVQTSSTARVGDVPHHRDRQGYVCFHIRRRLCRAHIIAWLFVTGEWPADEIDHIDQNKSNNAWHNLRLATHAANNCNKPLRKDNPHGWRGITYVKSRGKWKAQIGHAKRNIHIGLFPTAAAAALAYDQEAIRLHGEFAQVNFPASRQANSQSHEG